ncbi:hypothetical protein LSM04_001176 [Trypanosoma melophagium]|uniref:uncharacterized protein n=1 Tax=Trypanosoma melophagium TaxID=715481 RepID=UPI00351A6B91|nr:hypothetical protein LSM04_001176 [Trypanosoma melophagium]
MYKNPYTYSNENTHSNGEETKTPTLGLGEGDASHRHVPSDISDTPSISVEDFEMITTDSPSADNAPREVLQPIVLDSSSAFTVAREGSTDEIPSANKEDGTTFVAEIYSTRAERNPTFLQQLKATLQRVLLLKIRRSCGAISEFVVPTLFIIGTFILWKIIGGGTLPEKDYYNLSDYWRAIAVDRWIGTSICYNSTRAEAPFPGIEDCGHLKTSSSIICAPLGGEVPDWFCFDSVLHRTVFFYRWFARGKIASVPPLDLLITIKWINIILFGRISTYNNEDAAYAAYGKLFFAPVSTATAALVEAFNTSSRYFRYIYGGTHSVDAAEQLSNGSVPIWGIVQVNEMSAERCDVAIRLNSSALPRTNRIVQPNYRGGLINSTNELYLLSGFLTMQETISKAYLNMVTGVPTNDRLLIVPTPTAAYDQQLFLSIAGQLAPLIVVMGFLYPVSQLTRLIVVEKELRLREAMLIMGLSEAAMYFAWFVVYLLQYMITSLLMALIMKLTYMSKSNFFVIFLLLFLFSLSTITLSALFAALFSRARLAALLSPLFYFVFAIPLFVVNDAPAPAKVAVSLLSPSGFAVGVSILFDHELSGGMSISDITYFRDSPNLLVIMGMLLLDTVLYLLIMVYLDTVMPREWGTPKHPLFCILEPIRWCFSRGRHDDSEDQGDGRAPDGVFEEVEDEQNSAVRIAGLRKKFKHSRRSFLAVNNLYWSLREGEISVLLGHNGAGKSTTINMMTGMLQPDGGDCYVHGLSVRHQLSKVRQEIDFARSTISCGRS